MMYWSLQKPLVFKIIIIHTRDKQANFGINKDLMEKSNRQYLSTRFSTTRP